MLFLPVCLRLQVRLPSRILFLVGTLVITVVYRRVVVDNGVVVQARLQNVHTVEIHILYGPRRVFDRGSSRDVLRSPAAYGCSSV